MGCFVVLCSQEFNDFTLVHKLIYIERCMCMFDILLNAFLMQKRKKRGKYFIIRQSVVIVGLILLIISGLLYIIFNNLITGIVFIAVLVLFLIWAIWENELSIKKWSEKCQVYNISLNQLKTLLQEQILTNDQNQISWYTKEKICYLIEVGESRLTYESDNTKRTYNFIKVWILPIVAYISLVLKDTLDGESLILLSVICIIILFFSYMYDYITKAIVNSLFKNNSKGQIQNFVMMLKDLLNRDFSDL